MRISPRAWNCCHKRYAVNSSIRKIEARYAGTKTGLNPTMASMAGLEASAVTTRIVQARASHLVRDNSIRTLPLARVTCSDVSTLSVSVDLPGNLMARAHTVAWRYGVAGDPFVVGDESADRRLVALVADVLSTFETLRPAAVKTSPNPTERMRVLAVRSRSGAMPMPRVASPTNVIGTRVRQLGTGNELGSGV